MPETLTLRAHHLLLQGFQGYGYDSAFTQNLAEIVGQIKANPEIELKLTAECDLICSACPLKIKAVCQKEPEIKKIDLLVLKKLNLNPGAPGKAKDWFLLANTKLKASRDELCGACLWQAKCLWFTSPNPKFYDLV